MDTPSVLDTSPADKSPYQLTPEPFPFNEAEVTRLLVEMSKAGASDIKIQSGNYVFAKIRGAVHRVNSRRVPPTEVDSIVQILYGINGPNVIKSGQAIDHAVEITQNRVERYRFRINIVGGMNIGQDGVEITIRTINIKPPSLESMNIPQGIIDGLFPPDGIVLIVGPTGSGKSTAMAATLGDIIQKPDSNKIIATFEWPIEYVYDMLPNPSSVIWQTEIGPSAHLPSFAEGIKNAMRRAPDIIFTGETRDHETAEASIAAAQSGHAVYTTLHSNSVVDTFGRIIGFYPETGRSGALSALLSTVRLVVWQRLYPLPDGSGRVPVRSYLNFTEKLREELLMLGTSDLTQIYMAMKKMVETNGETIGQCATRLYEEGKLRKSDYLDLKSKN